MRSRRLGLIGAALLAGGCGGAPPAVSGPSPAAVAVAATGPGGSCARVHPGKGALPAGTAREGSTVALGHLGGDTIAYVADGDTDAIRTFDVDLGVERAVTMLPGSPSQLVILGDGRVAVTLRDKNLVEILEPAGGVEVPLEARCSAAVASEPVGIAVTPDDRRLLVTSGWGHRLTALDTGTLKAGFDVDVAREPRAVVVDDDGQRAFVSHVVGAKMSVVELGEGEHEVREIDLRLGAAAKKGSADKRRGGCQGFALAKSVDTRQSPLPKAPEVILPGEKPLPDVKTTVPAVKAPAAPRARIFAPMVTVDPGEPTVRSSGYGSANNVAAIPAEVPIVSVIDGAAERPLTRTLLTDGARHDAECILPRAAAVSPSGDALFVTCLGTDALLELDPRGLDPSRLERRRWAMPSGPTGVAVDDRHPRAVVWSQFDRQLAVVSLGSESHAASALVAAVGPGGKPMISKAEIWGRKLFHLTDDSQISGDGRACASCHPDGREDALTWSTPDGPRQTIMLAGRTGGTAPYGWMGAHRDLKDHFASTFTRLGGHGLPDDPRHFDEMDALLTYVGAMPGPSLEGAPAAPGHTELVARGAAIFHDDRQGCATCHAGGGSTDSITHDIGSGVSADRGAVFDTPSLRFVGGTAPYFHDGRYATLDDLLLGSDGKMGHTLQLSRRDVSALRAYLETL